MREQQFPISLKPEEKQLIIDASKLFGLSISSFIRSSAIENARLTLRKNKVGDKIGTE